MSRSIKFILFMGLVMSLVLAACGSSAPTEAPATEAAAVTEAPTEAATEAPTEAATEEAPAAEAALKVTGAVAKEQAWTEDEVKAMPTLNVESTNNNGEKATYTGVLISELIAMAVPNADATTVILVADDGFTAEVALADVTACENCILSFRNKGGFSSVFPGQSGKMQVKGVVEIQVK